jgi:transcriptional regulator with XRE-family HTH domain
MNSNSQPGEFGACLLKLRNRRKLSQKAVAVSAEMDQSYLAGLEAGRRPPPRDRQLTRLAAALNATPEEIKELREARALTRLVEVADELDPVRGKALASLACRFNRLSANQLRVIEEMASLLEQR